MLETAKKEGYAYPAVNVTTIEVINGALRAFSEAKSDGIIQVSIGGGKFASGSSVGNSALGAIVLAEATRRLAEKHNVLVALHTDHCQPEHVDTSSDAWRKIPPKSCWQMKFPRIPAACGTSRPARRWTRTASARTSAT